MILSPIVTIDIGSYAISGSIIENNRKEKILARVIVPSDGIEAGIIKNTRSFSNAIANLIKKLEKQVNFNITKINLVISGCSMKSFYVLSKFQINEEISTQKLDFFYLDCMKNFNKPEFEVLKYYPIEFILDGNSVDKPVGMIGKELLIRMHIIACDKSALDNMVYTLGRCHLEVQKIFPSIYVSGISFLTESELNQGTLLIDLGDSTITWGVFYNSLSYLNHIDQGISFINKNILKDLNLSRIEEARIILAKYAIAVDINSNNDELIYINQNQAIVNSELYKIVSESLEKLFEKIIIDIKENNIDHLIKKIYLIGGGANIEYIKQFVSDLFHVPVGDININKLHIKDLNTQTDLLTFLSHYGVIKELSETTEVLNNKDNNTNGFSRFFNKVLNFFE